MSRHGAPSRVTEFDERDTYYRGTAPPPAQVRVRERDHEETIDFSTRRGPERPRRRSLDFLRDDYTRSEPGQMVVRERERETFNDGPLVRRARSPSPPRFRERIVRSEVGVREPSPPAERIRTRIVEREKETPRSPSPPPQLRARVIETRQRFRERSPSPPAPSPVRIRERIIERERERERTPSPPPQVERIHTRIVEREREREPSPSPSPPPTPPPEIIRAPPIHREIITHHRHIDHGFERAPAPSPPPPPRRAHTPAPPPKTEKTEIDIYRSGNNTEVDITKTKTSGREKPKSPPPRREYYDDSILYEQERDKLRVRDTRIDLSRRRSLSARPDKERVNLDIRDEDEADFYARKVQERAVIGEAFNGATKDWSIIDVPPGTERIQLDGVGGGSQEITWQRYNGVRRSKFNPEREHKREEPERVEKRIEIREREREGPNRTTEHIEIRERQSAAPSPRESSTTIDIDISNSSSRKPRSHASGPTYEREREYERIEESSDRQVGFPLPRGPPKSRMGDLWTEITKDLVAKEAIEELGYDYEETEFFYYILQYLRYQDVEELVALSETVRRERQDRIREIERERIRIERREKERDDWERAERRRERDSGYDDERIIEREIIWDDHRRRERPSRRW
ncbi:uncharacterized protein EAE98_011099 [Botrytis deweyae]|uniref:DUF8035 domain-containing protein n=1 Tax=Botrytis deweyae TaxID=2478750 RepID=A0ABQ7I6X5_9HELO|nr:uncharacterized protein EAE98_011099 [Botrytis deweyae]KAF7915496.1 hypothetical protein EAE98_011099 [Botrytis deweyae]